MKIKKPSKLSNPSKPKLVKTEKQQESAFIVFLCIVTASILLIASIIAENL